MSVPLTPASARPQTTDLEPTLAPPDLHPPEEILVIDARAALTPSEMVEKKLVTLLRSHALPISHVQMLHTGMSRR